MNMLVKAFQSMENETFTENGAKAFKSTTNNLVDLFYTIGASRDRLDEIKLLFCKAAQEDLDTAVRILLYARDARGGMGERKVFREIVKELATTNVDIAQRIMAVTPALGRWDDLYAFFDTILEPVAIQMWLVAICRGDKNAAKWAPREKSTKKRYAKKFIAHLKTTPMRYRKLLARNTEVVEQLMSAKKWDDINFNHVPSVAAARYQAAFTKNADERYTEYRDSLEKDDGSTKINAGAIHPHDIIRSLANGDATIAEKQWEALPDYLDGSKTTFLPLVDVSGSMGVGVSGSITAMDVAISLGMYTSERTSGPFKNKFITFSEHPKFVNLEGLSLLKRYNKMKISEWGMSTDFEKAYRMILDTAIKNNVHQTDMPSMLLVLSDMQFNAAQRYENDFFDNLIKKDFENAGYIKPTMVYWNLRSTGNVPVDVMDNGTILVSGFSPSLMKNLLRGEMENVTPIDMVLDIVGSSRYEW